MHTFSNMHMSKYIWRRGNKWMKRWLPGHQMGKTRVEPNTDLTWFLEVDYTDLHTPTRSWTNRHTFQTIVTTMFHIQGTSVFWNISGVEFSHLLKNMLHIDLCGDPWQGNLFQTKCPADLFRIICSIDTSLMKRLWFLLPFGLMTLSESSPPPTCESKEMNMFFLGILVTAFLNISSSGKVKWIALYERDPQTCTEEKGSRSN